jgi:hypothetical protein
MWDLRIRIDLIEAVDTTSAAYIYLSVSTRMVMDTARES